MIDTKDQLEDITLEIKEMFDNIENLKSCVDLFDMFVEQTVEA